MHPCVRCLNKKVKRFRAGHEKEFSIIQCDGPDGCGFNVTAPTFEDAEAAWNGFRVWELVPS